ncbi:MAG: ATP-dependent DNA helicase, partial [Acidobacteriota bacterium]
MEDEIVLTDDQQKALEMLKNKSLNPFLLKGYAGTGKTTLITSLLGTLDPQQLSKICLTAPTNKAVRVIEKKVREAKFWGVTCKTIHSLLGLKLVYERDKQVLRQDRMKSNQMGEYDILVIDECSMVNEQLFKYIMASRKENPDTRIIYIGDPRQLPPVHELDSPTFGTKHQFTLTEVVRQAAENPMIKLSMQLREAMESGENIKLETNTSGVLGVIVEPYEDVCETMFSIYDDAEKKKDPDLCRFLAWTNRRVDRENREIRRYFLGFDYTIDPPPFLPNETIVTTAPVIRNKIIVITTDTEKKILRVEEDTRKGVPVWKLVVPADDWQMENVIHIYVIKEEGEKVYQ